MAAGHGGGMGMAECVVFLLALIAGTTCSLSSKVLLGMESVGMTGEVEAFRKPIFQTFMMFVGMSASLFFHAIVRSFKIPFPGYKHNSSSENLINGAADDEQPTPTWMYFLLVIPAFFDLFATVLCMIGLIYIDVSVYQMLRGGSIVFVALLKQSVLGDRLKNFMWIGVLLNVISIVLVGFCALFSGGDPELGVTADMNPLFGVCLILSGALVQSLQYAFEEKVMSMEISAPPLLLIGMEGFWGMLICLLLIYPVVYNMHGDDHGSVENPWNTLVLFYNSSAVQEMFVVYFTAVFSYNIFAVLVTYMLNSVWHAILDNFRPILVWSVDLFIYYVISTAFGEPWTAWSWLQVIAMAILLYGTAVYNAPNSGSILLTGGVFSCFMDFSHEYAELEEKELDKAMLDATPYTSVSGTSAYTSPYNSPFFNSPVSRGGGYGSLDGRLGSIDSLELGL